MKDIESQLSPMSEGHYINFVNFENPEDTERSFPPANWARVKAAKAEFDPDNIFRELDFHHTNGGHGAGDAGNAQVKGVRS